MIAEEKRLNAPSMDNLGLTRKEQERYSVRKAILATIAARSGHADPWKEAGLELEISQALNTCRERPVNGVLIPQDALVSRSFLRRYIRAAGDPIGASSGFGNATGGNLVATDLRSDMFIEALKDAAVVMGMGVTMLPGLVGDVDIPKEGADPNVYWVGEDTEPTGSDIDLGNVDLKFKTIGGWQRLTQKLLKQSTPYAEDIIRDSLLSKLALGIQQAIINGAGTATEPRGILNLGSLATVPLGPNGGAPTYGAMVDLETEVAKDNADIGSLGYLTNTSVRGKLKQTETFPGSNGNPVWSASNEVNGYQAYVTNAVPSNLTKGTGTNLSAIIYGNWADVVVGMWGDVDLNIDTTTHANTRGVVVRVFQDTDIQIKRDESFAAILDAVTL